MSPGLSAPHVMAFAYRRGVGGAESRFLSGLRAGVIRGTRAADGRVLVPPLDHDPATGAPLGDWVTVADLGVVRSWTWVTEPGRGQPLDRPFAFALVRLDGADTALLHVVDVPDEGSMATGMRVRADWRLERVGSITDIRAFVPAGSGDAATIPPAHHDDAGALEVHSAHEVAYRYEPGVVASRFFESLRRRRILGGRCEPCGHTYVPPRPRCPVCATGPMTEVPVPDRGQVSTYTVVHVPSPEGPVDLPYVAAWIRLDGVDVAFPHLLGEVAPEAAAVGQHVEAVWVPDDELAPSWESIRYFRPSDRPDPGTTRQP